MLKKAPAKCAMLCLLKMLIYYLKKKQWESEYEGEENLFYVTVLLQYIHKQTNATELDCGKEANCQTIVVKMSASIYSLILHHTFNPSINLGSKICT